MKIILSFILIFMLSVFSSCSNSNTGDGSGTNQNPDSGIKPEILQKGTQCAIRKERQLLITSAQEFEKIWGETFSGVDMAPQKPEVDFSKTWVVAAFLGEMSNGGFDVNVDAVAPDNNLLMITIRHTKPGKNCFSTMAIEYPYVFARIDQQKTDKTKFRIVSEIKDCGR